MKYIIEMTTKFRHPDQKVMYITDMELTEYGETKFAFKAKKEEAYKFTGPEAFLARRLLELSNVDCYKLCNYAVLELEGEEQLKALWTKVEND